MLIEPHDRSFLFSYGKVYALLCECSFQYKEFFFFIFHHELRRKSLDTKMCTFRKIEL